MIKKKFQIFFILMLVFILSGSIFTINQSFNPMLIKGQEIGNDFDINHIENGWIKDTSDKNLSLIGTYTHNLIDYKSNLLSVSKKVGFSSYANLNNYNVSTIPIRYYHVSYVDNERVLTLEKSLTQYINLESKDVKNFQMRNFENNGEYVCKIGFGTVTFDGVNNAIIVTGGDSGSPILISDIATADNINGWNQVFENGERQYTINCSLYIGNGTIHGYLYFFELQVEFNSTPIAGTRIIQIFNDSTFYCRESSLAFMHTNESCTIFVKTDGLFKNSYGHIMSDSKYIYLRCDNNINARKFVNDSHLDLSMNDQYYGYSEYNRCWIKGYLWNNDDEIYTDTIISNAYYGTLLSNTPSMAMIGNVTFYSCTYDCYIQNGFTDGVHFYDIETNRDNNDMRFRWGTSPSSDAQRYNSFSLTTEPNANIILKNYNGDVIINNVTDANGFYSDFVLVATYNYTYGNTTNYLANTPFTLIINKTGFIEYESTFNNSFRPINYSIGLIAGTLELVNITSNLILLYDFDDYNGLMLVDKSDYNNNGTRIGFPLYESLGRCGEYLNFDGVDDYIEVSDSDSLAFTGDLTIAFSFKTIETSERDIVIKRGTVPNRWYFLRFNNYRFNAQIYNDGSYFSLVGDGGVHLNDDIWHTVVFSYTNQTGYGLFVVDGVLNADKTSIKVDGFNGDTNLFVCKGVLSGGYFEGDLTNIVILNDYLSFDECVELHNLIYVSDLDSGVDEMIEIETIQFVIVVQLFLLCVFLWIGCSIPAMEGNKKSLHYMPFSGGLFIMFGGLDFISFSVLLTYNYSVGLIGGFLIVAGVILLVYGVMKAFYYE